MAESHMAYMHDTFPTSKDHDHHESLKHEHDLTHHDPMLRGRTEPHSVEGGGMGTMQAKTDGRNTI
jgi:hypothetical protein